MIDKLSQIRRICTLMKNLIKGNCYGEVTVKLQGGNIVYVEIDENKRLSKEETAELVSRIETDQKGEIHVRPTKGKKSQGLSLVTTTIRGSLEEVVPVGKLG